MSLLQKGHMEPVRREAERVAILGPRPQDRISFLPPGGRTWIGPPATHQNGRKP